MYVLVMYVYVKVYKNKILSISFDYYNAIIQ